MSWLTEVPRVLWLALPVIGPSAAMPGLIHAFGFSGHGFALSPLVGRLIVDAVEGRDSGLPLGPFAIARFGKPAGERLHA